MYRFLLLVLIVALISPAAVTQKADSSPKQEETTPQIEVKLSPAQQSIHPGETLKLRVEIWNVGTQNIFVAQNLYEGMYFNAGITMYIEVGGKLQGSQTGMAADAMPESNPDVIKTFVTNWLTLPKEHFYGTYVYMEPMDFPQLKKPGHYRVRGEYNSGGISANSAWNAARLNEEDIQKLPFKSWSGRVDTNFVTVQVTAPTKSGTNKK